MDDEDLRAWLIELAHGPTGDGVGRKERAARFFELADLITSRMEAWKNGEVLLVEVEALRDDYRAEGEVECAAGLQVLVDRGYAEREERARQDALLN